MRKEIELRREQFSVGQPGHELPDALNVEANHDPEKEADDCPDHADRRARDEKHAHDRSLRRPHRAQNCDVLTFVFHEHDQAGNNIERRNEHDQRQD